MQLFHALAIVGSLTIAPLPQNPSPAPSSPAADASSITEDEFVASVDPAHPAVAALRERIGIAGAAVLDARLFDAPELSLSREDPSGDGARGVEQIDLTVAWQLPSRSRQAAVEAAKLRVAAARDRVEADVRILRSRLREVFAGWAIATETSRLLGEHAERLRALADRERERAARGEIAGLRARRLELAAAEAVAGRALAEAGAEEARQVVAGWNAAAASRRPALPALPVGPLRAASEAAGSGGVHPRVSAIERELEAAELDRKSARRFDALPSLIAGWQRQDDGVSSLDGPLLGLSWRVPLVDVGRADRAVAEARVAGAEARLEQARRSLRAEREASREALRVLSGGFAAARASADDTAPLVDGTLRAFELGEVGVLELLDVLRSALDAETRALDLLSAALSAARRLELLTTPTPVDDPP